MKGRLNKKDLKTQLLKLRVILMFPSTIKKVLLNKFAHIFIVNVNIPILFSLYLNFIFRKLTFCVSLLYSISNSLCLFRVVQTIIQIFFT